MSPGVRGRETTVAAGACLLSGAAALVYEVLWARQLALLLGTTVVAASVVLAAFMGGLSLGSAVAGGRVDGLPRPRLVRLYALVELGIAGFALGLPFLLGTAEPLLRALHRQGDPAPGAVTAAHAAIAAVLLLGPTALMGATLPLLTALVAPDRDRVGRTAGLLYASNTLGAVLGSLASVFVLLPVLGMRRASLAAALLNVVAGVLVWTQLRGGPTEPLIAPLDAEPAAGPRPRGRQRRKHKAPKAMVAAPAAAETASRAAVLFVIALSGFGALANEVAWTRALVLLIGPTSYAFAFIVTAVIAGIALGSAAVARGVERWRRPADALAAVELLAALSALGVIRVIGALPGPIGQMVRTHADRVGTLMAFEFAGVLALLSLPCLCFGAAFPLAVRLVAAPRQQTGEEPAAGLPTKLPDPGRAVGRVYAWNTVGAIAGALVAGFAALPALGLQATLVAAAGAHALAASVAALAPGARRLRLAFGAAGLAAFALAATSLGRWDPELLSGGVYKYAAYAGRREIEDELRAGELVFYKDGATATVSVKRLGATLSLAVDGKVDATSSGDMLTQRLLAHVPLLLHSAPRDVCVIGLGSGVTAGSALAHPVLSVDAVEISADVVEAAAFFRHVNREALGDPRLRVKVADGRNHLLLTSRRYDVVISEPSNPWMAGVSSLFTRDFFLMGRRRLRPGGLFCQWAHIYNMDLRDLRTLVGGFTDAFPKTALFLINEGDILLVGGVGELPRLVPDALSRRMSEPAVRDDLEGVGLHGLFGFASLFALQGRPLAEWAKDVPRHTDDRPVLEFRAPRFIHADTARDNHEAIRRAAEQAAPTEPYASLRASPSAQAIASRAHMLEKAGSHSWAMQTYLEALDRDPRRLEALEGLVRCGLRIDRVAEVERELQRRSSAAPVESRIALALLEHNLDRPQQALAQLEAAVSLDPRNLRALLLAADIQGQSGNAEAMDGLARAVLAVSPGHAEARALLASAALAGGRLDEAIAGAEAVLAADPGTMRALEVAAVARAQKGDHEGARRRFEALVAADPDQWSYLNNFGTFELSAGNAAAAARLFERATDLHAGNRSGFEGLRQAALSLGDRALLRRAEAGLGRLTQ